MKAHLSKSKHLIWTPLQIQIFVLVVSLFSLVLALTLFSIYNAAYNQAERQFVARLNVGHNVFVNEITNAKNQLDINVDTVAKDWALRSAIGAGDNVESIRTVLFNFGSRIEADIAIVLNTNYQLIAQYGSNDNEINTLALGLDENQKQKPWIAMLNGQPYLISSESINAPGPIGWLIMGKPLSLELMERIKSLISLDISLAALAPDYSRVVLSTKAHGALLENQLLSLSDKFKNVGQLTSVDTLRDFEVATLTFELFTGERDRFMVILQSSTTGWMQTLKPFMFEVLPFFLFGLVFAVIGSYYIARTITRPVGRLLEAAKLVASGRYTETIEISDRSELGELAKEFASMQMAVMEREQKITDQAEEIRQTNKAKYQIEMVRKEQQLAVDATEAKGRFLANVSHELRTPLNSIIGYTEMLMDDSVSAPQKEKANHAINQGGQYLLNIVNDVLDLAKIEAGKIQLEKKATCIVSLVEEVKSYMKGYALEKDLEFGLKLNYPLPANINIDATRLKQVLLNLCNNAIKFTDKGRVDLQIYLDRNRNRFIFVVSDTGQGLSEEQQLRLFSAFSQGQQAPDRRYGGTGLGLYISKQLTEMMGGHIKVTSQLGLGSQFAVYFPWETERNTEILTSQQMADNLLQNKRSVNQEIPSIDANILCVDDNEDNLRLVEYLLHKTGARTTLARNGKEALALNERQKFDLILMDMQMPEMDGLDATQRLLSRGFDGPIVMLTANVDSDSKDKVIRAGATEHFSKPIDTEQFYTMLKRFLNTEGLTLDKEASKSSGLDTLKRNYIDSFTQKAQDIETALNSEDLEELKHLMHKIKGSAGSYGFNHISEIATQIEDALQANRLTESKVLIQKILALLRQ